MSNYRRPRQTGATIFFTVVLAEQSSDLLVAEIETLRQAVRTTRDQRPFGIDAWVVLPDHMHAIWTLPPGDRDFSTRWKEIKARFTKATGRSGRPSASKIAKGEKGIWQRRFWDHHIRDEADLATHLRYCWTNPVKHGLTTRAVDWPYSSLHREIRAGRVDPTFTCSIPDGDFGEPLRLA